MGSGRVPIRWGVLPRHSEGEGTPHILWRSTEHATCRHLRYPIRDGEVWAAAADQCGQMLHERGDLSHRVEDRSE